MIETTLTSKGTTTIPQEIRDKLNLLPGTTLVWSLDKGCAVVGRAPNKNNLNSMQQRLAARAGTWSGKISGTDLLKQTRGLE
ncbi:MAG: AbrB/MazE/SpoVT family DNA-binding domain-containing protein [Verrucomicrobiota bacterium]